MLKGLLGPYLSLLRAILFGEFEMIWSFNNGRSIANDLLYSVFRLSIDIKYALEALDVAK